LARRPSGRFADFSEIGVHTCLCLKLVGGKGCGALCLKLVGGKGCGAIVLGVLCVALLLFAH
jgi:hypothetical protein